MAAKKFSCILSLLGIFGPPPLSIYLCNFWRRFNFADKKVGANLKADYEMAAIYCNCKINLKVFGFCFNFLKLKTKLLAF